MGNRQPCPAQHTIFKYILLARSMTCRSMIAFPSFPLRLPGLWCHPNGLGPCSGILDYQRTFLGDLFRLVLIYLVKLAVLYVQYLRFQK